LIDQKLEKHTGEKATYSGHSAKEETGTMEPDISNLAYQENNLQKVRIIERSDCRRNLSARLRAILQTGNGDKEMGFLILLRENGQQKVMIGGV
jgi:hypothetical protein